MERAVQTTKNLASKNSEDPYLALLSVRFPEWVAVPAGVPRGATGAVAIYYYDRRASCMPLARLELTISVY